MGGVGGSAEAEPQHLVADVELGDVGPDGGHHTRKVAALAGRKRGGEHLVHRPDPDAGLAGIDAGGAHLDHHLARAGRRHIDVRHI